MDLLLIDNVELLGEIEEINNLLDTQQKEMFRIIPKNIEYNFGEIEVWFGAITALYTVVQIIERGVNPVKLLAKNKQLKYKKNDRVYEVKNVEENVSGYTINIDDKKVEISIDKGNGSYSIKIDNLNEVIIKK
jgi:hypothetical protein